MKRKRKRILSICMMLLAMPLLMGAAWSFVELKDPNPMVDLDLMIEEKQFPWSPNEKDTETKTEEDKKQEKEPDVTPDSENDNTIRIRVLGEKITVNGKLCKDKETLKETIQPLCGRHTTIEITDYYAEYYTYESVLMTLEEMEIDSGIVYRTANTVEELG